MYTVKPKYNTHTHTYIYIKTLIVPIYIYKKRIEQPHPRLPPTS